MKFYWAIVLFLGCVPPLMAQETAMLPPESVPATKIGVMETAFGKRGDVASFALAKAAGYTAIQMHSGNPPSMKRKNHDQSMSLPIGDDPAILESWMAESYEANREGKEPVSNRLAIEELVRLRGTEAGEN